MSNNMNEHTTAPKSQQAGSDAAASITEGLDLLMEEAHPLGNVVQAFRELLVERARFKAELRDFPAIGIMAPDPSGFERGNPLSSIDNLIDAIDDALWAAGARRLMPVMENSYPKIREELQIIGNDLLEGRLNPRSTLKALLAGCADENAAADRLNVSPQTLTFALGQLAKPVIEKLSYDLRPLVENLSWTKGYCPICGTMPELAFLQEEGGQRWLRCASCSHEWRFTRLVCPFCESDSHESFETYYVEGREHESVEVCLKCKRYVPTIDFRNRPKPIAREVAAMALLHLDLIAQKKDFLPVAVCAWNIVGDSGAFSPSLQS